MAGAFRRTGQEIASLFPSNLNGCRGSHPGKTISWSLVHTEGDGDPNCRSVFACKCMSMMSGRAARSCAHPERCSPQEPNTNNDKRSHVTLQLQRSRTGCCPALADLTSRLPLPNLRSTIIHCFRFVLVSPWTTTEKTSMSWLSIISSRPQIPFGK